MFSGPRMHYRALAGIYIVVALATAMNADHSVASGLYALVSLVYWVTGRAETAKNPALTSGR
jgi:hypothetical protein